MTQPNQLPAINLDAPRENRSPLIRFTAVLDKHEAIINEPNPDYGRTKQSQSVKFYFTDVVVIESHEPYPFPIADLTIPHSTAADTRWAAWTKSVRDLVPADQTGYGLDLLVGKKQEWFYKPARLRMPLRGDDGEDVLDASGKPKWGVVDGDAWQVVAIEGMNTSGKDLTDLIVDGLDGKLAKEFLDWLFTEQALKSYPGFNDIVEAATDRKLLPHLVTIGKVTEDAEGRYHRV